MTNIKAQQWLDKRYPKIGVCKREKDKENINKERKTISNLDIRSNNIGSGKILCEELKLNDFVNLETLNISKHDISSLDLSKCPKLKSLYISHNKNIRNLNLSSNLKLEEINFQGCNSLNLKNINLSDINFILDGRSKKLIKSTSLEISPIGNDVRNILIIGLTHSGKSSLANTLSNTNEFKSSNYGVSETKCFQESEPFTWEFKGNQYKFKVIDNIGFGDTKGEDYINEILYRIGEGILATKEGVNQVLFLVRNKFDPYQVKAFETFKSFINENKVTEFTTLIRTDFPDFLNTDICNNDKDKLRNENKELSELIRSCNEIIHINNPPIVKIKETYKREQDREKDITRSKNNEGDRNDTRKIILDHLSEKCNNNYKLNWKDFSEINNKIANCLWRMNLIEEKFNNPAEAREHSTEEKKKFFEQSNAKLSIAFGFPQIVSIEAGVEFQDIQVQGITDRIPFFGKDR